MNSLEIAFLKIFQSIETSKLDLLPSQWAEKYRTLTRDVSTLTGKYKYSITPYLREIIDTLSPYHPAKIIAIIKGSQIGMTEGVIVNGILWTIANNPGNILALSADDKLSQEMVESRLDQGIQSCGIQHLIRPNTIRKRNQRTGDTSSSKEFAGGRAFFGGLKSINKLSRQRSIQKGFFDDWEAAPISDPEQGNLFDLLQQRFTSASKTMKQYYISTPETRPSNIEQLYLKGDQRKWMVPCPICGKYIELIWHELREGESIGITFQKDEAGKLIDSSVGYVCQECSGFFKEKHKYDMNLAGKWVSTAEPSRQGFYSYHISCLNSAPHMYNWTYYARNWLEIYADGIEKKSKLKVFINQVLGQPWEERKMDISAKILQRNTREYEVGTVPNKLSKADGNGQIVLITCACDLNGTIDDARLDYDVWAHAESGSIYSIDQGSIGTYQPGDKNEGRDLWSYKEDAPNNVWDYFWNEVLSKEYVTDEDKKMKILYTGVDTGYFAHFAYGFIDQYPASIVGLKGRLDDMFHKITQDVPKNKPARERANLFILESDLIKDELSEMISLRWTEGNAQPAGFMNFPQPGGGKYTRKYFEQFENETRVLDMNEDGDAVGWKWVKKTQTSPNHFWDTACYNLATRDIFVRRFLREVGIKNGGWGEYVEVIKKIIE
jgi:phage terminase large subunit GpA-like protein